MGNKNSVKNYTQTILEIYKLHVEMADRISHRRGVANNWFITINTSIITVFLFVVGREISNKLVIIISVFILGIALNYIWIKLIKSYKELNTAKFKALHKLESKLPLKFLEIEDKIYKKAKRKDFSDIEITMPRVLILLYFVSLVSLVFLKFCLYKVL